MIGGLGRRRVGVWLGTLVAATGLVGSEVVKTVPHRTAFPGARYLIIAADSFVDLVQPWAEWKTAKGMLAQVVPLSEAGSTPQAVREFVRNAWSTWPVRPEYLLLVANPNQLPGKDGNDDGFYGDMTGRYQLELAVGRLPAFNRNECRAVIAKWQAYELARDLSDSLWLLAGTTVVGYDDSLNPDPYYIPDCRFVHGLWLANGYRCAESLYANQGATLEQLRAAFNSGRSFITYRGAACGYWDFPFWQFAPDTSWHNGRHTPIIVAATCATVTLAPGEEMLGDRAVRFGTAESLGGAVA